MCGGGGGELVARVARSSEIVWCGVAVALQDNSRAGASVSRPHGQAT